MAKFKKNFWRERETKTEEGKVVPIPEPAWYAKQYDPTDRLGGYKGIDNPRPSGVGVPKAKLIGNGEEKLVPVREAFYLYRKNGGPLKFELFKVGLLNGTKFPAGLLIISKP